ncbi:CBS domain-containing protein CBSX3, mitochondrial [Linum perenne]
MLLTMQGAIGAFYSRARVVKTTLLQHVRVLNPALRPLIFSRSESVSSAARIEEHGFEHTTISDVLSAKDLRLGFDLYLQMTQHNVGSLVVVKPGEQKSIAGIITERDYLRKIIVQGRSSKMTKVGDIMTA